MPVVKGTGIWFSDEGEAIIGALAARIPSWQRDARCTEYDDPSWWFPERGESSEPAKAVCARCAVRQGADYASDRRGPRTGTSGATNFRLVSTKKKLHRYQR